MDIQYSKQAVKFLKKQDSIVQTLGFMHYSWEEIPEITPDEIDLQMIKEMESDPDCHEFISEEELLKELGI